jgi:hypothetical protein
LLLLPPAPQGFVNRMFHPNVDETAGSVCLDVINQTWSPMFDLVNIFEVFLPQLLLYPNPADPLNGEAAALLLREPAAYNARVKELVARYATPDDLVAKRGAKQDSDEDEDEDMGADEYVSSDDEGPDVDLSSETRDGSYFFSLRVLTSCRKHTTPTQLLFWIVECLYRISPGFIPRQCLGTGSTQNRCIFSPLFFLSTLLTCMKNRQFTDGRCSFFLHHHSLSRSSSTRRMFWKRTITRNRHTHTYILNIVLQSPELRRRWGWGWSSLLAGHGSAIPSADGSRMR